MICFLLLFVTSITEVLAFSGPTRRFESWRRSQANSNGGCGGGPPRPPIGPFRVGPSSEDGDDDSDAGMLKSGLLLQAAVLFSSSEQREGNVSNASEEPYGLLVRGGDASGNTQVVQQPKLGVLHKLKAWWGALTSPLRGKRQGEQDLQRLKSVKVDRVTAPNSTVLPPDVLREASQNLIGNPLTRELVQDVAVRLKDWYVRNGYVLNSITGATLVEDDSDDNDPNKSTQAEAQLVTQEPVVTSSQPPVRITFCKPMVYDSASGQHMAPQDYTKLMQRSGNVSPQTRANITYVETKGRTNPKVIARILGIKPGQPFCWSKEKWDAIVQSGLFSSILQASPATVFQKGPSGNDAEEVGIQLNIACVERPPCRLEYGMSKNLYSGAWEGEVDLLHTNLLGAGQSLDLSIRKGGDARRNTTASPYWMPSVHLQYKDSKFGLGGGYEVDLFHDDLWVPSSSTPSDPGESSSTLENNDPLVTRQGGTVRWQNLPYCSPQTGGASVSLEQTLTQGGKLEQMGSTRFEIGPFYSEKGIPLVGGRSSVTSTVMVGSQYKNNAASSDDTSSNSSDNNQRWLPYTLGSVMMRQAVPFKILGKKEVTLALQHSASTSTKFLPRHECNALGLAARIRGYPARSNGVLSSSLVGTTELRVPISLPSQLSSQSPSNDGTLVLFSDYAFMERSHSNERFLKSSIGVGLRKSLMNVPVKVDFCITKDGKPGAFVGVGHDFDV